MSDKFKIMYMTSLNIDEVGSPSVQLSWGGTNDGTKPVYTVNLLDTNQKPILSVKTDQTSLSLKDLDPSTKYIFKLSKPLSGILPYISNIRIEHKTRRYLGLAEVLVFDLNGRHMKSTEFNLTSSAVFRDFQPIIGNLQTCSLLSQICGGMVN